MIIEKLDAICIKNGTNLTSLCKEITGSSGNLPTWKKDRIRPEWLRAICIKFNISSDYLLDLPNFNNNNSNLTVNERNALQRFNRLKPDYQIKAQAYMVDLYEKQESQKTFSDTLEDWLDTDDDSVAADESLKKASGK